jgi:hypothetical protein
MPSSTALVTDPQLTLIQLMDAHAAVLMNSRELTVPFHQLARVCAIAADMLLMIKTVRMAAIASVNIHGMAMIAP